MFSVVTIQIDKYFNTNIALSKGTIMFMFLSEIVSRVNKQDKPNL